MKQLIDFLTVKAKENYISHGHKASCPRNLHLNITQTTSLEKNVRGDKRGTFSDPFRLFKISFYFLVSNPASRIRSSECKMSTKRLNLLCRDSSNAIIFISILAAICLLDTLCSHFQEVFFLC